MPDERELSLAPEHECAAIYCQSMSSKQQVAPYCPVLFPNERKLSLAPEHECAAIYCQSMSSKQQVAPYCPAEKSSCYLVVDIGGSTGDISVHRVLTSTPDQPIEVILHSLVANDWGGSRINREFEKLLGKLVSDEKFSRYLPMNDQVTHAKNWAELNELVNEKFEKQKVTFGNKGGVGKKTTICLPFTFLDIYKNDIDEGIRRMKDFRLKRTGESLRIEYSMMADFFHPVVKNTIRSISQAIHYVEAMGKKVDTIYLVGGFGGSEYIRKRISEKFGETYKCIIPPNPNSAVIHGAVLFH